MRLDPDFIRSVLVLLIRDREFLRQYGHRLTQDDFSPQDGSVEALDLWMVSGIALEHWRKFSEPIGPLLWGEVEKNIRLLKLGQRRAIGLKKLTKHLLESPIENIRGISARIREFKQTTAVQAAIDEVLKLQASGELDAQTFLEIARRVVSHTEETEREVIKDYFQDLETRLERRRLIDPQSRYPVLFIDPLDAMVRAIARGQLACVAAPYKRGKSMFLIWVAVAYMMQRLNVLYVTLEDPCDDVEDRFDAAITQIPLAHLREKEEVLKKRIRRFKSIVRGRLRIYDGTEKSVTVHDLENLVMQQREEGFLVDALIVDYDDEIHPSRKHRERRMELAEIYRDLRRLASKHKLLVWTAAQTQRGTDSRKILTGDTLAEDISKARKVGLLLSLGAGDWGEDSIYVYVAAHKYDRQHVGCSIYVDRDRMLIYDRARTLIELGLERRKGNGIS